MKCDVNCKLKINNSRWYNSKLIGMDGSKTENIYCYNKNGYYTLKPYVVEFSSIYVGNLDKRLFKLLKRKLGNTNTFGFCIDIKDVGIYNCSGLLMSLSEVARIAISGFLCKIS